jgi:hypothetical protein
MPRRAPRSLIRYAGLAVFWLGLACFLVGFGNWDEHRKFSENLLILSGRLYLALAGASLYAVARIPFPLIKRTAPPPFDFNAHFAPYIIYTPIYVRVLKWLLGALLIVVSLVFGLAAKQGFEALTGGRRPESDTGLLVAGAMVLLGFPAFSLLFGYGMRFCARQAERSLRNDRRLPFLYLRSFHADTPWLSDEVGLLGTTYGLLSGKRFESYEHRLVLAVSDIGPLVAIGKPGEKLPPLGAARIYIRDDADWKRVVIELIAASRAVFLRVGRGEGFWWELKHVVANCDPCKVIICLPQRNRARTYAYLRAHSEDIFPRPLPEKAGEAMFLAFDSDWEPHLLRKRHSYFLRRFVVSRAPEMRDALNRALAVLGVPQREMPYVFREYALMFVLFILLMQCCLGILMQSMH